MPCPRCGHPSFYFNLSKQVGYCHSAHCHWTPNRVQLDEALMGKGRARLNGVTRQREPEPEAEGGPLEWPSDVVPLLDSELKPHCELCEECVHRIVVDRHVPRDLQQRIGIRSSENRIYIPVYDNGELVQYVGRAKWWIKDSDAKRYRYAPDRDVQQFLFSWDTFKTNEEIALVENTFNALWLRPYGVTTNFGSNLSDAQIDKISQSRVRRVVILWDEGAGASAEKAVKKLGDRSVSALFVRLLGQPDGHREDCIADILREAFAALSRKDAKPINVGHQPCAG